MSPFSCNARQSSRRGRDRLSGHLLYSTALIAIIGSGFACSPAIAQSVTATGDVAPAAPAPPLTVWNPGNLRVGVSGQGEVTVSGGGVLAGTGQVLIGANAGSEGTVTVSGTGSLLSTATQMHVGSSGKGALTITGGATANIGTFLYIGRFAGAEGTVTVSGAGSSLTSGNMIQVGSEGKGSLTIENGATVSNTNVVRIGLTTTGEGSALVRGAGSSWISNNSMTVGHGGRGALTIQAGGLVRNVDGFVGREAGATGEATVSGAGSTWTNTAALSVGEAGTGTLTVNGGGKVENTSGSIGSSAGGNGTVTVTGPGSTWANSSFLYVANLATGALTVSNGGVVTNAEGRIGNDVGATGTVTVTGADSSWTSANQLRVGNGGNGTLLIADGGHVQNAAGWVGGQASAVGAVTVKDAGSIWTNTGTLYIGDLGKGTLTVSDGGKANISSGLSIGRQAGAEGLVTVSSAGSSLINTNTTQVGGAGKGTLIVENGGVGQSTSLSVGVSSGSTGSVVVRGADSRWTAGSILTVGASGQGMLTIDDGGSVTSTLATIGSLSSGIGEVTVSGTGSTWTNGGALVVGALGNGTLTISDGGMVSTATATIAAGTGRQGTALVSGAGSRWITSGDLTVGTSGNATLTVADGGHVDVGGGSGIVYVAANAASNSVVNVGAAEGDPALEAGTLGAAEIRFGAGNGEVRFNHTGTGYLFTPIVTGTGSLRHYSGTTILTGASTYIGGTTISGGVLQLGNGGMTGSIVSDVAIGAAGTLRVDRSNDWTYAGIFSGTGTFDQSGTGTTILTGNSAGFAGTTTVTNGRLIVGTGGIGALGGTIDVLNGATLGGSGTVGSVGTAVTVADGGRLSAGNSIGTLTVAGDLVLNSGSILDYELGAPGTILGSGTSDHIAVAGHLTLDGTVNLSDAGGAGLGYYRLMTYGGLTDNGLAIGTTPALGTSSYEILTGGGFVDLVVGATGDDELQIWQGGDGVWNATNLNWLNQGAEFPTTWASNHGAFTGAGGLVDVTGVQSFKGLQFVADGYVLGGAGTIETVAGGSELRVLGGVSATIGTEISGPGGIAKTQGGTLTLTGTNTYAGGTIVEDGVLSVAADGALGNAGGGLTFNGGILQVTGDSYQTTNRAIALGVNGGGFDIASAANVFTLGQGITGTGDLYKLGLGTLTLTGTNSYGDAFITQGALQAGTANSFAASSAYNVNAGAVLDLNGLDQTIGSLAGAGNVTLGAGTLTTGGNDSDTAFGGVISGAGGVIKTGDGAFILTGANTFAGDTVIAGGVLQLGNGGATGSLVSDVEIGAAGTLRVDRSNDWTHAGILSGTGAFAQSGTGTTTLTGDSSGFSGTTTVANGSLIVGIGGSGALGGTINVLDGATLGGSGTVGSSGTTVEVADGGILAPGNGIGTLSIAGDLKLNAGSILNYELGAPGSVLGGGTSDHIAVAGHLTLDGVVNLSDAGGAGLGYYRIMSYGGLTDNGLGIGTTPSLGTSSYEILTGGGYVDLVVGAAGDGELQIWQGGDGVWNAANVNWLNQGAEFPTIWASNHGAFTGAGGLVEVEGTQTFKGLQFVAGGYELAGDGTLQTVAGDSELRVLAGVSATIGTEISGPGGIVKTQGGTLILTGSNSYTGGTTIEDGILSVAADSALGHADGGLTLNGGIFQVTGDAYQSTERALSIGANGGGFDIASSGNVFTLGQDISGTGDLYKLGAGTLVFTGTNSYAGNAIVSGGVLQLGNGGTTGSVSGNIQIDGAGTLRLDRSDAWTYAGTLSGTGAFNPVGSGATTLTGDSSGFGGTTTVANGSLIVGQGGIGALGGTVNVLSGATLGGSGTIGSAGTTVTIAAGGIHAPGNGLGQQTILGDYVLRGALQIDGTPTGTDTLRVGGNVDIAGSTLDLRGGLENLHTEIIGFSA